MQAEINFTDSAATKAKSLILEEQNLALNLRVGITGGGCSGYTYGFSFDEQINDDDFVVEKNLEQLGPIKLLVDSMSYQLLRGATIDYRKDINGEHFIVDNPNAKTTCGCGASFDV